MAERRMFAKTIILSDAFLDMPATARCLYFTLAMVADDDGFVNSPRAIMRQTGATNDDMLLLVSKKFVIAFDSGVIVIKHWRIHNYIQNDRYMPTKYKECKEMLTYDENKAYTLDVSKVDTTCIQNGYKVDTQVRLGKDRLGKDSNNRRFTPPSREEIQEYCILNGYKVNADKFIDYYEQQGWKLSNGNAMKVWKAAIRNWAARDKERDQRKLHDGATERDYTQEELRSLVNDPLAKYYEEVRKEETGEQS